MAQKAKKETTKASSIMSLMDGDTQNEAPAEGKQNELL